MQHRGEPGRKHPGQSKTPVPGIKGFYSSSLDSQEKFLYSPFPKKKVLINNQGCRMRVGLLSDTHIPEAEKNLPAKVMQAFQGVDLILHAGDIYIPSVLDILERIAPVLAALGDDDYDFADTFKDKRVKEKHILKLEGQTLWLVHVQPYHLKPRGGESSPSSGQDNYPDIVVFGHAHYPLAKRVDNVLYVNPGSPTFLHYKRGLGTVGILDIDSNKAEARILQL